MNIILSDFNRTFDVRSYFTGEVNAEIGEGMDVHNELRVGFLKPLYSEGLEIEPTSRSILFTARQTVPNQYRNRSLKNTYLAHIVAYNKRIVEIKAIEDLSGREEAQLLNYSKATEHELSLLINSCTKKLE